MTKKKHPGGRPPKLTDELETKFLQLLRTGVAPIAAANAVGICGDTYFRWMARGRKANGQKDARFVQFLDRVTRAKFESECRLFALVSKGAERDPKLALELLKTRRFGTRYATARYEERPLGAASNPPQIIIETVQWKPKLGTYGGGGSPSEPASRGTVSTSDDPDPGIG